MTKNEETEIEDFTEDADGVDYLPTTIIPLEVNIDPKAKPVAIDTFKDYVQPAVVKNSDLIDRVIYVWNMQKIPSRYTPDKETWQLLITIEDSDQPAMCFFESEMIGLLIDHWFENIYPSPLMTRVGFVEGGQFGGYYTLDKVNS